LIFFFLTWMNGDINKQNNFKLQEKRKLLKKESGHQENPKARPSESTHGKSNVYLRSGESGDDRRM
jgi:hypothetical protein